MDLTTIIAQIAPRFNPATWTVEPRGDHVAVEHKTHPLGFTVSARAITMTYHIPSLSPLRPAMSITISSPNHGAPAEALLNLAADAGSLALGFSDLPHEARARNARRFGR